MQLRTRITATFLGLLAAVLLATLYAVSAANRANAEREVELQLETGVRVFERVVESNRRQLTQAAELLAADFAFREAVATGDAETQVSALENHGARIGADIVVLVAPGGGVLASTHPAAAVDRPFAKPALLDPAARDGAATLQAIDGGIYQLVAAPVRSPLLVAWVVMGFRFDAADLAELAEITGLAVTLEGGGAAAVSTLPADARLALDREPERWLVRRVDFGSAAGPHALLSRSLAEARAPFDRLRDELYTIAAVALLASGLLVTGLARQITAPLRTLMGALERIRSGDYHAPVTVRRADEIGQLADGLRTMQSAVDTRDRAIRELAFVDALTGLRNRVAFTADVDARLAAGERGFAVAVIDLDRFRRINECLGYTAGDAILREFAARLRRMPDLAAEPARLAADQFAVATVPGAAVDGTAWAQALLDGLAAPVAVEGQPVDLRATVGVALAGADLDSADLLLRAAELALGGARRAKRPAALHDGSLRQAGRAQLTLWGELQRAIELDQLALYVQPKCRLADGLPVGAECLLRWRHPTRGLLGPGEFVPFAEQTGFVRELTHWALRRATAAAASFARAGWRLPLAVNVSAVDLHDARLVGDVRDALARESLAPALLTLEITESGFIDDPERALEVLRELADLGVGLSIDDFGTGYSSLSYLARMPVGEIKIDRSFVAGLADPAMEAVVRSALELAQRLELDCVAEGIENAATVARLREAGCSKGQGYHYAKPMPVEDFAAWLAARLPLETTPGERSIGIR